MNKQKIEEERMKKEEEKKIISSENQDYGLNKQDDNYDNFGIKKNTTDNYSSNIDKNKEAEEIAAKEMKGIESIFNYTLVTDKEKEIFREGKKLPYLKENLMNIIKKHCPEGIASKIRQHHYCQWESEKN